MKKLLLFLCIMLLGFGFAGVATAGTIDFAQNGSFEDPIDGGYDPPSGDYWLLHPGSTYIENWVVGGNSVAIVGWVGAGVNNPASDGQEYVQMYVNSSISQVVDTPVGSLWEVWFDMSGKSGNGETELNVSATGAPSQTYTFDPGDPMTWNGDQMYTFTATSDETTVTFTSGQGNNWAGAALDHVRMFDDPAPGAHAPEPATMVLLGAGLIGLAGLGRKKIFRKAE